MIKLKIPAAINGRIEPAGKILRLDAETERLLIAGGSAVHATADMLAASLGQKAESKESKAGSKGAPKAKDGADGTDNTDATKTGAVTEPVLEDLNEEELQELAKSLEIDPIDVPYEELLEAVKAAQAAAEASTSTEAPAEKPKDAGKAAEKAAGFGRGSKAKK